MPDSCATSSKWAFPALCAITSLVLLNRPNRLLPGLRPEAWLIDHNVHAEIAGLFDPAIMLIAALLGAGLTFEWRNIAKVLGLDRVRLTDLWFGPAACVPAALTCWWLIGFDYPRDEISISRMLTYTPAYCAMSIGLLVTIPVVACGKRFWPTAVSCGSLIVLADALYLQHLLSQTGELSWISQHKRHFFLLLAWHVWSAWLARRLHWRLWPVVSFVLSLDILTAFATNDHWQVVAHGWWVTAAAVCSATLLAIWLGKRQAQRH